MRKSNQDIGKEGEAIARDFLESSDYRIVAFNFIAPIGNSRTGRVTTGEIDIIAYDLSRHPNVLAFVEVKTRSSDDLAAPEAAVDRRKQRQIIRAARVYRRVMAVTDEPYRFDVVTILAIPGIPCKIKILKNYFRESNQKHRRDLHS